MNKKELKAEKYILESFNCTKDSLDVFFREHMVTAIICAMDDTKKKTLDEVKEMIKDCIKRGLSTEFILLQGIPIIENKK